MIKQTLILLAAIVMLSANAQAGNFTIPKNVAIDGDVLRWDAVADAGGYNIYWNYGYLTTVKGQTSIKLQIDGIYQVVAFDLSETLFSNQFDRSVAVTFDVGAAPSISEHESSGVFMKVVSVTCENVGPGESCVASCEIQDGIYLATGGACSTSDIVEADAFASVSSYSCAVPTFSGEVTAQVYCIDRDKVW